MNKKIVVAVISILCVCAIAFAIYWDATEFSRYRNKEIDSYGVVRGAEGGSYQGACRHVLCADFRGD